MKTVIVKRVLFVERLKKLTYTYFFYKKNNKNVDPEPFQYLKYSIFFSME